MGLGLLGYRVQAFRVQGISDFQDVRSIAFCAIKVSSRV